MRSFHKDYTLYSKYVYIPTLRQKVFLCVMRCDVTLYDYGSPEQLSRLCWCVLLLLCALWYCIELLLSAMIVQFVMPRARAGLAAKWYWPIAPNSTQLTRTHHLSPGYWLQFINIVMLYKKLLNLIQFWTKSIRLHEWNVLIVIAITPSLFYQVSEDVQMPWLIFNLRWWVSVDPPTSNKPTLQLYSGFKVGGHWKEKLYNSRHPRSGSINPNLSCSVHH